MTTVFLDIHNKLYVIKCLTYNITTKSYKIDTEKIETWEKATFSWPPESADFVFIESLFKNLHPTKIESMYQTIWINDTSLNEANRKYSKSTWWKEDAFESWHSLQVDATFSARRTLYNNNLLDTKRKSFTSQIAGYWESTSDNTFSPNSPNRTVRQPLCDSKNFRDAGKKGKPKFGLSSRFFGQEPREI